MTFLLVASSTSKAGTIVPAASGSIFSVPLESLSTRSATNFRLSKIVREAGQLACTLRTTGAWAVAWLPGQDPTVTRASARTTTRRIGVETLRLMTHLACGLGCRWTDRRDFKPSLDRENKDIAMRFQELSGSRAILRPR